MSELYDKCLCHIVVNHSSKITAYFKEKKQLLKKENLSLGNALRVDLKSINGTYRRIL